MQDNKVLLMKRHGTGFADGYYADIGGHLDGNETVKAAIIREAFEEANIILKPEWLKLVCTMHTRVFGRNSDESLDFFFISNRWENTIINKEPHKHENPQFFPLDCLPSPIIPYIHEGLNQALAGNTFVEYGWNERISIAPIERTHMIHHFKNMHKSNDHLKSTSMKYRISIMLIMFSQPALYAATSNSSAYAVGSHLNAALGNWYHAIGKALWKYTDEPLSEDHELLARTVEHEISHGQPLQFYKLPTSQAKIGPHCVGNHIYLSERDYDYFAHNRDALRFVIAHEIMHVEKFHHLKKFAVGATACIIAFYLMKKIAQTSPFKEKITSAVKKIDEATDKRHDKLPFLN